MAFSRAERRHHRERLYRKRLKESLNTFSVRNEGQHCIWAERNARLRVTTATLCSCPMCGNPRRYHGNSKASLTRQEWKMKDQATADLIDARGGVGEGIGFEEITGMGDG